MKHLWYILYWYIGLLNEVTIVLTISFLFRALDKNEILNSSLQYWISKSHEALEELHLRRCGQPFKHNKVQACSVVLKAQIVLPILTSWTDVWLFRLCFAIQPWRHYRGKGPMVMTYTCYNPLSFLSQNRKAKQIKPTVEVEGRNQHLRWKNFWICTNPQTSNIWHYMRLSSTVTSFVVKVY